jgi:hypothetical protein
MDFLHRLWAVCQYELQNVSYSSLLICSLIGAIFVHGGCLIYVRLKKHPIYLSTELAIILLISYLIFMAQITVLDRELGFWERTFETKALRIDGSLKYDLTNLLNIILFIPLGALLAGLQLKKSIVLRSIVTGSYCFLISLLIECAQYATNRGYFEIDDIEANILGGFLGCLSLSLCFAALRLICTIRRCEHEKEN